MHIFYGKDWKEVVLFDVLGQVVVLIVWIGGQVVGGRWFGGWQSVGCVSLGRLNGCAADPIKLYYLMLNIIFILIFSQYSCLISFLLLMNLRHKKPINSYKGQTNNDKSEFNDDDFKQQGSAHKKANPNSTDQIYKYAKILYKFAKVINQDYRNFDNSSNLQEPSPPSQPKIEKVMMEQENQKPVSFGNNEQNKQNKQIKQYAKLQERLQIKSQLKTTKTPSRRPPQEPEEPRIEKPAPPIHKPSNIQPQLKERKKTIDLKQGSLGSQGVNKEKKQITNVNNFLSNSTQKNGSSVHAKLQENMNISPKVNLVDNNLLSYLNMSNLLQQNVFQNNLPIFGANPISINQLLGQYPAQANIFRESSLGIGLGLIGLNGLNLNPNQMFQKPIQNLFSEQVKTYNTNINVPPNSQLDKAYVKKVYPLKRNAYHVTIAYKIYLDKLKKDGVSIQNFQEIDPTRNARRVKNGQPPKGSSKQSVKKKK